MEIESAADRGNVKFCHRDCAAVCFNRADRGVDVIHCERTFEADHSVARHRVLPLLQEASDPRIVFIARCNQVEIRRSPRFEAPAEGLFIKSTAASHVVAVNGEPREIVRHGASIKEAGKPRLRGMDNKYRESASLPTSLSSST